LKESLIVYTKDLRNGSTLPFIPSPQGRGKKQGTSPQGRGKKQGTSPQGRGKKQGTSPQGRGKKQGTSPQGRGKEIMTPLIRSQADSPRREGI
jgi:hypothetical protein